MTDEQNTLQKPELPIVKDKTLINKKTFIPLAKKVAKSFQEEERHMTSQQTPEELRIINGLADDFPVEMTAGQFRKAIELAESRGRQQERGGKSYGDV